ncbi:hypothetical protein SVIOM342S_09470 [Streptomyces violaceorubidus]
MMSARSSVCLPISSEPYFQSSWNASHAESSSSVPSPRTVASDSAFRTPLSEVDDSLSDFMNRPSSSPSTASRSAMRPSPLTDPPHR